MIEPLLKLVKKKNVRIIYFVATGIPDNKKYTKIVIQLLEILMNIPISGLSTYNKRFLLF